MSNLITTETADSFANSCTDAEITVVPEMFESETLAVVVSAGSCSWFIVVTTVLTVTCTTLDDFTHFENRVMTFDEVVADVNAV